MFRLKYLFTIITHFGYNIIFSIINISKPIKIIIGNIFIYLFCFQTYFANKLKTLIYKLLFFPIFIGIVIFDFDLISRYIKI